MEKTTNSIAIALLVAVLLLGACTTNAANKERTIGLIAPLSGEPASWGEAIRNGAELAAADLKTQGTPVKTDIQDGKCDPKTTVAAMQYLITVVHVQAVIGFACSGAALAAAPIANEHDTLMIVTGASVPELTRQGKSIFRLWPSDTSYGQAIAASLEQYSRVAIIRGEGAYYEGIANSFTQAYRENRGIITSESTYPEGSKQFQTMLLRISEQEPEAILIISYLEGALIVKQVRELGIDLPIIANDVIGSEEALAAGGDALDNVQLLEVEYDEGRQELKRFMDRYTERYGESPNWILSANAYDAMMLAAGADGARLPDAYTGISGSFTFDEDGDIIRGFEKKVIVNGTVIDASSIWGKT